MIIGVDLDDVLGDFVGGLCQYHNREYGTSFKKDDFHSFKFWEVWGGNKKQAVDKVSDFYETPEFKNLEPMEGAQEAVDYLSQDHELRVVTSRPPFIEKDGEPIFLEEKTKKWLDENFPNKFSEIYFANNDYIEGSKKTKEKLEYCLDSDIDILVEDALQHMEKYCQNKITKVFLSDSPWNQGKELPENVERVYSWDEIVRKVDSF